MHGSKEGVQASARKGKCWVAHVGELCEYICSLPAQAGGKKKKGKAPAFDASAAALGEHGLKVCVVCAGVGAVDSAQHQHSRCCAWMLPAAEHASSIA
jgi:hypothetical protein